MIVHELILTIMILILEMTIYLTMSTNQTYNMLFLPQIRGMPYEATATEVCRFFKDCDIAGGPDGEQK